MDSREFWKAPPAQPVIASITISVLNIVSLLEMISKVLSVWYTDTGLAKALFSITIRKRYRKQFILTWNRKEYSRVYPLAMFIFQPFVKGYFCLCISQNIRLVNYIDVIILVRQDRKWWLLYMKHWYKTCTLESRKQTL